MSSLTELRDALRTFAQERNWGQYHSPKNLAMAMSVEAAEVVEHFQWLTEEASRNLNPEQRKEVGYELADVLLYLVQLADALDIDLLRTAKEKMELNAIKHSVVTSNEPDAF